MISAARKRKSRARTKPSAPGVKPSIAIAAADPMDQGPVAFDRRRDLKRQGVKAEYDSAGYMKAGAHRSDVFEELHARGTLTEGQVIAARRLQRDMIDRMGRLGGGEIGGVRSTAVNAAGATDRMIEAGRRVDLAMGLVGPPSSRLLRALLEPDAERGERVDWRKAVEQHVGETRKEVQGGCVRMACQSLADVYDDLDRKREARQLRSR